MPSFGFGFGFPLSRSRLTSSGGGGGTGAVRGTLGGQAYVYHRPASPNGRLVIFFHGIGGNETAIGYPTPAFFTQDLLDEGYTVGCTNAHGNNCGNNAGIADNAAFLAFMQGAFTFTDIFALAGSHGGLASLIGIARGDLVGFSAWAGVDAVTNAEDFRANPLFTSIYNSAHGLSGGDPIPEGFDPLRRSAADYSGLPMRFYGSAEDTVIKLSQHGALMAAHVQGYVAENGVHVPDPGGDHSDESHWNPVDTMAFYDRYSTGYVAPAGFDPSNYRPTASWFKAMSVAGNQYVPIPSWEDSKGSNDVSIISVPKQPVPRDIGGNRYISLDGANDYLERVAASGLPTGNDPWSVISVFRHGGVDSEMYGWGGNNVANYRVGCFPTYAPGGGEVHTEFSVTNRKGGTIPPYTTTVLVQTYNGTVSTAVQHSINGLAATMSGSPGEALGIKASPTLTIGGIPDAGVIFNFMGDIGQLAILSEAMTPSEVAAASAELLAEYADKKFSFLASGSGQLSEDEIERAYSVLSFMAEVVIGQCKKTFIDGEFEGLPYWQAGGGAIYEDRMHMRDVRMMACACPSAFSNADIAHLCDVFPYLWHAPRGQVYGVISKSGTFGTDKAPEQDNNFEISWFFAEHARRTGSPSKFLEYRTIVEAAHNSVPTDSDLPYLDPALTSWPDGEYTIGGGFWDGIRVTGHVAILAVLKYRSAKDLAFLLNLAGFPAAAAVYEAEMVAIASAIESILYDSTRGLLKTCTDPDNPNSLTHDLPSTGYGHTVGAFSPSMVATMAAKMAALAPGGVDFIAGQQGWRFGQLRHMPTGYFLLRSEDTSIPVGTYQNGGYWFFLAASAMQLVAEYSEDIAGQLIREGLDYCLSQSEETRPVEAYNENGTIQATVYGASLQPLQLLRKLANGTPFVF